MLSLIYSYTLLIHLPIVFYLQSELELEIICKDETVLSYGMTVSSSIERKTIPSLSFASPSSGSVDEGGAKMHLDEAMKALQAGDSAGAEMHMTEADKVLQESAAKMHLGEAIKALQAGDTAGAETHAQMAQDNL